tara:strand:- start:37 stop:1248 length:1212 start_codon:yes stop_codon:yes gene_type:complete
MRNHSALRETQHSLLAVLFSLISGSLWALPPFLKANDSITVFHEKTKGGYRLFISNSSSFSQSVQVTFTTFQNIESPVTLPFQSVVTGPITGSHLFDIKIIDPTKAYRFNYDYDFTTGDARSAKHQEDFVYLLPFEHGTLQRMGQGYHGEISHSEPGKEYAIDFPMPIGTPIAAARSGVVTQVKENSDTGGASKSYEDDGNQIVIMHDDGSFAEYVHLKQDGAIVELGDNVNAGDTIAHSGNTGRSTGPHLHFSVGIPTAKGKRKTIPTRFLNHRNQAVDLVPGAHYFAYHPGKPSFEAVFPKVITNEDYKDYKEPIPQDNQMSGREETIDDTVVFFIRNGFPIAKVITFDIPKLENLAASKPLPITLTLEPLTEQFVVFARQKSIIKQFRYKTHWDYRNVEE